MSALDNSQRTAGRWVLVALSLLAVFALTLAGGIWHQDTHKATCPICHLAHLPMVATITTGGPPALTVRALSVPADAPTWSVEPLFAHCPPRAPPA